VKAALDAMQADVLHGVTNVALIIEKPDRKFRGSVHVVSAMAAEWLAEIKRRYPRKVVFLGYVDPAKWRADVIGAKGDRLSREEWKERALMVLRHDLRRDGTHDEAEAYCLMVYAKALHRIKEQQDRLKAAARKSKR
jgi:hypothetical protein